jgi:hypothetical protein
VTSEVRFGIELEFCQGMRQAGRMSVNDEIERIWKEAVVACFKLLSKSFLGCSGNDETPWYSQSAGRDENPGPPKNEAEVIISRAQVGSRPSVCPFICSNWSLIYTKLKLSLPIRKNSSYKKFGSWYKM